MDLTKIDETDLLKELDRRKRLQEQQANPFGKVHLALDLVTDQLVDQVEDHHALLVLIKAVRDLIPKRGKAMLLIQYRHGNVGAPRLMMLEDLQDAARSREHAIYQKFRQWCDAQKDEDLQEKFVQIVDVFRMGPGDATFTHFIHAASFPPN